VARQAELHSVQDDLAEAERTKAQQHSEILDRVKRFFGL
jgi:hypothetical protein